MTRKLEPVSTKYGAPMGRMDRPGDTGAPLKFRIFRVRLDAGGYDNGGAYWGHGQPLYCAEADPVWGESIDMECDGARLFIRADSRKQAKLIVLDDYPNARFFR